MSLSESLKILKEEGILDNETYIFLEKSRLIRNRIAHRYKEPSHEDLLKHISANVENLEGVVKVASSYL